MWGRKYWSPVVAEFRRPRFWRDVFSEFVGTFFLVGSHYLLSVNWMADEADPDDSLVRVRAWAAAGNSLVIVSLVWVFWEFGGAHMNPAVTFAFAIALRISFPRAIWYIVMQILASFLAALFVQALTPNESLYSMYWLPRVANELSLSQCFAIEVFCSFILVITYLSSANSRRKNTRLVPCLAIGAATGAATLASYWSSGAVLNPARAFGSVLLMRSYDRKLAVYWCGPLCGGLLAAIIYFLCLDAFDHLSALSNMIGRPSRIPKSVSRGELKLGHHVISYHVTDDPTTDDFSTFIPPVITNNKPKFSHYRTGEEELFLG